MQTNVPEWTSSEEQAAARRAYEDELVRRYQTNLPLTNTDKRDARRILRERAVVAKASA